MPDYNRLTMEDLHTLYDSLAAPLPAEAIEHTKGSETGKQYNTTGYGYQYVVNRFNEVLGPGHVRATIVRVTTQEGTTRNGKPYYAVLCELCLQIGNWIDGQWQPIAEASAYGGHDSLVLADAHKGAYTNAYKKAAAFFGPGRQAYEASLDDDNQPTSVKQADVRPPSVTEGECAVTVLSGTVTTSGHGDTAYTQFTGQAVTPDGETFPIKGFRKIATQLAAALEKKQPIIISGSWHAQYKNWEVKSVRLAVAAAPAPAANPLAPTSWDDLKPLMEQILETAGPTDTPDKLRKAALSAVIKTTGTNDFEHYTPADFAKAETALTTFLHGRLPNQPNPDTAA